jgi:chemotaxis protein methyltransferase CheR
VSARPWLAPGDSVFAISMEEFRRFKAWIHGIAGINLADHKHALVTSRLAPRLRHYQLADYGQYFRLLTSGEAPGEAQIAVDLLTTNETHFFREPGHFDFLHRTIAATHDAARPLRVWSAASSSGEEPYSIAMTLAAAMGQHAWEVLASDLSSRVLERAKTGHYAMKRAASIPREYLHDYCLKGIGERDGTFLVDPAIRDRIRFLQINLNEDLPRVGEFDAIFLRNVMIYFDQATKRRVVSRLVGHLRRGGYLLIGHAESLNGVSDELECVTVSIYRKP